MGIDEIAGSGIATIELGGETYTLSALTLKEYATIESDMREEKRKELVSLTSDVDMPPLERVEYISAELKKIDIVTAISTQSKSCIASMAYHSIKRKHPKVKYDEVAGHMTVDKMTEIAGSISIIMGTDSKNEKGQAGTPK